MGIKEDVNIQTGGKGKSKVIIKKDESKNGNTQSYNYNYSTSDTADMDVMVFVDELGNVTTTGTEGANIVIKNFEGDMKDLEAEIEKLTNEAMQGMDTAGGSRKKVMVFVTKEIIINDIDAKESSKLPPTSANTKGREFHDFKVFPVPAKRTINTNLKRNTNEELNITLFDSNGKAVLKQKMATTESEINQTLDVSGIKAGVYYLQLLQGKRLKQKR